MKIIAFILSLTLSFNVLGSSYVACATISHKSEESTKECLIKSIEIDNDLDLETIENETIQKCCSIDKKNNEDKNNCCDDDCDCNCCHSILIVNIQLPQNQDNLDTFTPKVFNFSKTIFGYQYQKGLDFKKSIIHPPAFV